MRSYSIYRGFYRQKYCYRCQFMGRDMKILKCVIFESEEEENSVIKRIQKGIENKNKYDINYTISLLTRNLIYGKYTVIK